MTDYLDDWLHFLYVTAGAKDSGKSRLLDPLTPLASPSFSEIRQPPRSITTSRRDLYTIIIDEVDKNEEYKEAILDLINYSTSRTNGMGVQGSIRTRKTGDRVPYLLSKDSGWNTALLRGHERESLHHNSDDAQAPWWSSHQDQGK